MNNNIRSDSLSDNEDFTLFYLSDIWRGFLKFWWVFLVLAVLGAGAAFTRSYFSYQPVYSTSCTLAINTDSSNSLYSTSYNSAVASEMSSSFSSLLSTNVLQKAICNELGIDYVSADIVASAVTDTNMVVLTASGPEAQETYDIMLSAINNYPSIARYMYGNTEINMITDPYMPQNPVNRNKNKRSAVNGALLGLVLAVVWVFLYVIFRNTVRTRKDIKNKLGVISIGVLPQVTFRKYNKKEIDETILMTNPLVGNSFVEALRLLRNTVLHNLDRNDKIIAVSSSAPGEGKSTVTVNLAATIAEAGKKVLLIDADIRNPSTAKILKINVDFEDKSEMLKLSYDEETKITLLTFNNEQKKRQWKIMRVDYIQSIVDTYRNQYDYIFIDTPPAGLISDASIVAQVSDAALFVILQDVVRISRIKDAIANFTSSGIKLIGCILNGAASGVIGYGENYGYKSGGYRRYTAYGRGYRYGYYYGYGEKNKKKKSKKD